MAFFPRARILSLIAATGAMLGSPLVAIDKPTQPAPGEGMCSPVAETVARVLDGWHLAEAYAAEHPGCEVFVGCGDSMLPLYRDHTVLVVHTVPMVSLHAGMTVIFTGDSGRLVAHTLLEPTPEGWRAIGAGNREPDRTRVRRANLVGVVVKAYATAQPWSAVTVQ